MFYELAHEIRKSSISYLINCMVIMIKTQGHSVNTKLKHAQGLLSRAITTTKTRLFLTWSLFQPMTAACDSNQLFLSVVRLVQQRTHVLHSSIATSPDFFRHSWKNWICNECACRNF